MTGTNPMETFWTIFWLFVFAMICVGLNVIETRWRAWRKKRRT